MSREWKPGTVAIIGEGGGVLAFRQERQWATVDHRYFSDWQLGEFRSLVVIDPEDRDQVERLAQAYLDKFGGDLAGRAIADQMQAALREFASPAPPRIDEPMGLGAVIEDEQGVQWVRRGNPWVVNAPASKPWVREDEPGFWMWSDIAAIRVLSEGIQ